MVTPTLISRGRRGTIAQPRSFCVAGVALGDIHLEIMWQAWHNRISMMPRDFAWQAWHLVISTLISRGTVFVFASFVLLACLVCYVPACWMVAPACFIFGHVFCCFQPVFYFACLRVSCLWSLRHVVFTIDLTWHCFRLRLVCSTGLFSMLCSSMLDGRSGMLFLPFSACLSSGMFLLSACFGMFDFGMFPSTHTTHLRPRAGLARGRYDRRGPDRFCFLHAGFHHVVLVVLGPTRSCRQQL